MARALFEGVDFAYPDALPLLCDVNLHLPRGFTAVAGPNGSGKTTLLRLLADEIRPTAGRVRFEPEDPVIAYCRQAVLRLPKEVELFGWQWDGVARRLRSRLGLDPDALCRWGSLSPGERQRWQVCAALHREPDVMLLDEPTNHLDAEARTALTAALSSYRGIGVLVAHDRAFLDALASRTVWIERGRVDTYEGTYSEARIRMHAAAEDAAKHRREKKRELGRLAAELEARRRRQRGADRQLSARHRMKGPKDSDARSTAAKGRAANGAAARARSVATFRTRVETSARSLATTKTQREIGRSVFVDWEPAPKNPMLRVTTEALRAGDRVLLAPTSFALYRDSRVHIAGPNGAGKTTLLRAIVAKWHLPEHRLLWLPQELCDEERRACLERARRLTPEQRGPLLGLVAALGVDPEALMGSRSPSPGEARKLLLAEGLLRQVWLVVLDEPTNHLDVPSIERLEAALTVYPGAILMATHDERLARATTMERWTLAQGELIQSSPPPPGIT